MRRFFALANQHMRWQLNDLARRLDERPAAVELREGLVPAPANSESGITPDGRRESFSTTKPKLEADVLDRDPRAKFLSLSLTAVSCFLAGRLHTLCSLTWRHALGRCGQVIFCDA